MAKKKLPPEVAEFFRREGKKGGKKAAAMLTPEQRTFRAKKAVEAREAKRAKGRTAILSCLGVGLLILLAAPALVFSVASGQSNAPVTYTLETEIVMTNIDASKPPIHAREMLARAADGSVLSAHGWPDQQIRFPGYTVREVLLTNGSEIKTMDPFRVVQTQTTPYSIKRAMYSADMNRRRSDAMTTCAGQNDKLVSSSVRYGQLVYTYEADTPTALVQKTVWPAGGCIELEAFWQWKDAAGKVVQTTSKKVAKFNIGEPDKTLFDIPQDYKEELSFDSEARFILAVYGSPDKAPQCLRDRRMKQEAGLRAQYAKYGPNGTEVKRILAQAQTPAR